MPLNLGELRTAPCSVARLPKLDVAGSSPVARSESVVTIGFAKAGCGAPQPAFASQRSPNGHQRLQHVVTVVVCGAAILAVLQETAMTCESSGRWRGCRSH